MQLVDHILDIRNIQLTLSDSCVEGVQCLIWQLLHYGGHRLIVNLHLPVLETSSEELLSVGGFLEFSLTEFLTYLVACLCAYDDVEPVLRRLLILTGHNLHYISGLELLVDPHSLAVHLSSCALHSKIGVDVEGEIQYGGPCRKLAEFS